ncbi:MAG UNVERIFIED_CONTAM: hypothetical protein LVQ98_05765 [Rickettsiaceae bacterium]
MNSDFKNNSFLFAGNSVFVEEMYEQYLQNPSSVDASWQDFFKNYDVSSSMKPSWGDFATILHAKIDVPVKTSKGPSLGPQNGTLLAEKIITHYRNNGHLLSHLDPLGMEIPQSKEELGLDNKSSKYYRK